MTPLLTQLCLEHPQVWFAGFDASNKGQPATTCPHTPQDVDKMYVWLSGHVTATDERKKETTT